jgi:spore germination cell wall hydrolase CwlJ-like protein
MKAVNYFNDAYQELYMKILVIFAFCLIGVYVPAKAHKEKQAELIALQAEFTEYKNFAESEMTDLNARLERHKSDIRAVQFRQEELKCLADNIYYESGYEPFNGKVAVAQVTMNRVRNGSFPNTVCGVVYQKYSGVCQFSWVCQPKRKPNRAAYQEAKEIAARVYDGAIRLRDVRTALYFHADYVDPYWKKHKIYLAQIGRHIFYTK